MRISSLLFAACIAGGPLAAVAGEVSPSPVASVSPSQPGVGESTSVAIPSGTKISVASTEKISSANAQIGDIFSIIATEDIAANGYVVVTKGAGGQAEIASVEKAHGNGGSGKLGIKMNWITAVDGEKIRLTTTQKTASEEDRGGGSSTATILSYALLGPLGLFFHNFSHGKDVILGPTNNLTAFVDSNVHVMATTRAQENSGFAH